VAADIATKPDRLFGRDTEWAELAEFAGSRASGATLGLVYGRRRQGKTLMLDLLARETGGFFFGATQQSQAQNLADVGSALALFRGLRQPIVFGDWREALDEVLRVGESSPRPVVIDEFPYLVATTPALPSYVQQALSPTGHAKSHTRTRLVLCGSALTTMGQLLGGGAPLRGRAVLELVVRPFGFREAAAFWGLSAHRELAFRVHALVGGTPAYQEMCGGAAPRRPADFDAWVVRRLLNPASAMFREGSLLLREEPSIADPTPYAAVLAALASGRVRRNDIAGALGRPASALAHLLTGLEEIGLVERLDDALRDRRSVYRVGDPMMRLYQLIISRHEAAVVAGRGSEVWERHADTVSSKIYEPHFEELARQWCLRHASAGTLGGSASVVRPTEIPCRQHRQGHEVDVVAISDTGKILAIGEAKGTASLMDPGELSRLDHLRDLLPSGRAADSMKLLLFARSGFAPPLRRAATDRPDVELIDLARLYTGS
jgi:AAA+ ATPase superfamily predicted ATPase